MPASVKRAAAYIRVSTEDQAEYSPDAQLVEIRKYAAHNGFVLPDSLVFLDEGISGKGTAKREAFNQMIGMAKQKPRPFDAILLWKFSRFARNREDSVVYKSMLRKQLGIDVISISEPVGDDKMSILIEALIEAMDEYYSINLAEEVKRGMTEKARRGELQATPAFGYRVEQGELVPIPEEGALVRAIFARFIAGEGLFPIAKWLNTMGVKTHRGGRFENRTIEYILRNPVYIGKLRWNPTGPTGRNFSDENIILAAASHDPLITQETWDAAQSRMALIKAQWRYHGRPITQQKDWISGMVRCAECNATLVFTKPHYWKCNGYVRGSCPLSQHISDEKLKGMILARMAHDFQEGISLTHTPVRVTSAQLDEEAALAERHNHLSTKLLRLREAYLAGVETLDSYAQAKSALEKEQAGIQDRLAQLRTCDDRDKLEQLLRDGIQTCLSVLQDDGASKEKKQLAFQNLVDGCTFSKVQNTLILTYHLFVP